MRRHLGRRPAFDGDYVSVHNFFRIMHIARSFFDKVSGLNLSFVFASQLRNISNDVLLCDNTRQRHIIVDNGQPRNVIVHHRPYGFIYGGFEF